MLADWSDDLAAALGIDLSVDVDEVLELARVAAHTVARPAAPLTTFLVGYAAGARGGGPEVVRELSVLAKALAEARGPATA